VIRVQPPVWGRMISPPCGTQPVLAAPSSSPSFSSTNIGGLVTSAMRLQAPMAGAPRPLLRRAAAEPEAAFAASPVAEPCFLPPTAGAAAEQHGFSPPARSSSSSTSSPAKARHELPSPGVRFMSSVQELRFAPSSTNLGDEEARKQNVPRASSWRATTTPEGQQYFYNATTKEMRWEPPSENQAGGLLVGAQVRVFSNSHQQWCDGYVERICRTPAGNTVIVAFKPPVAQAAEWVKKELPAGHKDMWCSSWVASSQGSTAPASSSTATAGEQPKLREAAPQGFQDTALPTEFTPEEQALYDELFEWARHLDAPEQAASPGVGPEQCSEFLKCSKLPNKALKQVWQASNPDLKEVLGLKEFRTVCRLVAHCQASLSSGDPAQERLLRAGGGALRNFLRSSSCLAHPPPRLPEFQRAKDG